VQELQEGSLLRDLLPLRMRFKDVYTLNFRGNSQALDHIYVTPNLRTASNADILHVNSGVSEPRDVASDHDPVVAVVRSASQRFCASLGQQCPAIMAQCWGIGCEQ